MLDARLRSFSNRLPLAVFCKTGPTNAEIPLESLLEVFTSFLHLGTRRGVFYMEEEGLENNT